MNIFSLNKVSYALPLKSPVNHSEELARTAWTHWNKIPGLIDKIKRAGEENLAYNLVKDHGENLGKSIAHIIFTKYVGIQ